MLIRHTSGQFPQDYIPTVFDNYSANAKFEGQSLELGLWDTGGREDYDRLRPLSYPQTDVFLVCFSVINELSFANIATKWLPELRHHARGVPMVLVGTKADLRDDDVTLQKLKEHKSSVVDENEARKLARQIGAECYIECSSKEGTNVAEVFECAVRVGLTHKTNIPKAKSRRCDLL